MSPTPEQNPTTTAGLTTGTLLKDNDPREPNRILRIHGFTTSGKAILRHREERFGKMFETRVSLDRIYRDGKPRKSGWSVVQNGN